MIIKNCLNNNFVKSCIGRNIRQFSFKNIQLNEVKLGNSNATENVHLENEANEEVEIDEGIKPRDIYYKFRSKVSQITIY
jgi:LEA14-like dessication related protein